MTARQTTEKKITRLYMSACRDDESLGDSNSIINQKRYLEGYATDHGYGNIFHYTDEAVTGTKTDKRKDFNRLMADARKGKIDWVLVKPISRFARNTKDCLAAVAGG